MLWKTRLWDWRDSFCGNQYGLKRCYLKERNHFISRMCGFRYDIRKFRVSWPGIWEDIPPEDPWNITTLLEIIIHSEATAKNRKSAMWLKSCFQISFHWRRIDDTKNDLPDGGNTLRWILVTVRMKSLVVQLWLPWLPSPCTRIRTSNS